MTQRLVDAWREVELCTSMRVGGAPRLRKALEEMEAAALEALIENAIWHDNRQTHAEVEACSHPRGRNGCPGDSWPHGCYNHRAHDHWAYYRNQAMYAAADARKSSIA